MTKDARLTACWIVAMLLLAIAFNATAIVHRAKADHSDPREFYTRPSTAIHIDGFSSRRHRYHRTRHHERPDRAVHQRYAKHRGERGRKERARAAKTETPRRVASRDEGRNETQILPHPSGCPRTSFCGCGASLEVFGRNVRRLWLAANWYEFPRSEPAPGRVAVRNHHVFVIRKVLSAGKVLAYDANSGGHQTRLHVRSLAGYSVRDPHAGSKHVAVAQAGQWEP